MFQRPDHADLVNIDAQRGGAGFVDAQQAQCLKHIQMCLAGRHDAEPRLVAPFSTINGIGAGKGHDGVFLMLQPRLDLRPRKIGPAVMQTVLGRGEVRCYKGTVRLEFERHAGFNRFRDRLEANPHPRKARQGIAPFRKWQEFGHVRRVQNGHEKVHERHVRLVRHG